MVVIPADVAHKFFAIAIAPQAELVRLDRVDAELDRVSGAAPLWPGIAEEPVGKKAELDGSSGAKRHRNTLGAVASLIQTNLIIAWRQIRIDSSRGGGMDYERCVLWSTK